MCLSTRERPETLRGGWRITRVVGGGLQEGKLPYYQREESTAQQLQMQMQMDTQEDD